jgi:hypothetical protein
MPPGDIFSNFISCIRSRNPQGLHADILEAHYSAACCHLGNIAYRLGKQVPGGQDPAGFPDVSQVDDSIEDLRENLRNSIGLELENSTYQLGAKLEFDPETERFIDNDEANKMLTRDYRDPFVVTEVA